MPRYEDIGKRTRLLIDAAMCAVQSGLRDDARPVDPLEVTTLEQRILMSASPMAALADCPVSADAPPEESVATAVETTETEQPADEGQEATQNAPAETVAVELVVIDPSAEDHERLVADLRAQDDRHFEILVLNPREDGIAQISQALQEIGQVSALHLVSHGEEGEILLGTSVLSQRTLDRHLGELMTWQNSLTADADLLIYGCDLAASEEGVALTESLNTLIGADVAASNDDTGHAAVGGDWEFEHQIGTIETQVAFTSELQENWSHLLNVSVDATSTGTTPAGQVQEIIEHTTAGTDRLILVAISFGQSNGESVASVTYGGENLTLVGVQENADVDSARVEIWSLTAPAIGTADVIVNYTGGDHDGAVVGVTTFNGVDQAAALRGFTGAEGDGDDPSVTTTSQADDLVFAAVALEDEANVQFTPGSGQTEQFDLRVSTANGAGSVQAGATGASTFSANGDGPFAIAAVAIQSTSEFTENSQLAEVSEFRVHSGVNNVQETSANSRGSHRAIGIAEDGSYVIVYSDSGSDGNGFGIFARQFNADGSPRSAAFQVNVDSFGNQRWATVAVDASGRFVVAWTSQGQDGDGQGIYLRRFNADGTAIDTDDIRVNSTTAHNQINPSVAINDSGQFVVVWQGDANNDGIYAKRFNLTAAVPGNVIPGNEIVVDTGNNRDNPSVDINNDGKFVVVWERGRKPHAQRFDADGTPRGSQIDINPPNFFGTEVTPSVIVHDDSATTASGDFVVTYRSEIGGFQGVWFKRYLDDGSSLGAAEKVSTGNSHTSPSIAKANDGSFIIVYQGNGDGDGQGVFARKYSGDGTAQSDQFQVNQSNASDQQYASVALLDLNHFVVVWSGNGTENGQEDADGVFARQFGTASVNSAPVADPGPAAITIREGQTLSLDASGSSDPQGDGLTYEWDFIYDGVTFFPSLAVTSPTVDIPWDELRTLYDIDDNGTFEIALRVSDGSQTSAVVVQTLTVVNTPPTIVVTGPAEVSTGEVFTLNLAASDFGNDTITAWHIDWGDGTIETIPGTATTATHVFATGGFTQNITVSVTDEDGTHHASQLVATSFASDVLYLNSDTAETITTTGDGPFDIEQGPDGLLYVSNFNSNSVDRFDPVTGDFFDRFVFDSSGGLLKPSRIAFGPDQSLFVTSMGTNEVLRFGNDGRPLGPIVTGIDEPDAIAFDAAGTLYVSSQTTGDIFRFDAETGARIDAGPFVSFGQTTFIDLNFGPDGNLFASSTVDNVIREFDTDGNIVDDFGGRPLTEIDAAGGFTRSANGDLYVTDFTGTTIARYDSTGAFIETLGTDLSSPFGVLFTASHQVRINDTPTVTGETYTVTEGGTLLEPVVADWFNINWKARQEILLDNSASSTDLTDFAVLVTLHETDPAAINIDYGRTRDAGEDLRFVDPDGSLLDYEIEAWDESGYSYVWVRVPRIDAGSTTDSFFLYYDNDQASDGHSESPVWSPDFTLAQHNNGGGNDSSGNDNNGGVVDVSPAPGIVAGAASFNGTTSRIITPASPGIDNTFAGGGTVSAWINPEGYGENNHGRILDKANATFGSNGDGWALQGSSSGNLRFEHGFTGSFGAWVTEPGSISLDEWQQVVVVYNTDSAGNDPQIYINGVEQTVTQVSTPSGTVRSDAGIDLTQGNFSGGPTRTFDGLIDEVRVRQSVASADEIRADYLTVTGAQTSTNGTVQTDPGGLLANDADREGDNLTVSLVTGPTHAASFTLNPDGSFEYVHDGSETTSDSFTYTVTDGFSVSEPVTAALSITPVSDAPVLSSIADVTTPEDTAVGPIAFTVQDSDTTTSSLIVNATSSDQNLIADSDIMITGSGVNRTLSLTPQANASGGPITITLEATDGTSTTTETFEVTITPVSDAPAISPVADITIAEDTSSGPIAFTVTDVDDNAAALVVTATSGNQSLIADADITVSGSGSDRMLSLSPQANVSGGPVIITIEVADGSSTASETFSVTITPASDAPVISPIGDITIDEDSWTGLIDFTVGDIDDSASSLVVTATSSDQSLVADADILVSGSGTDRTLSLSPRANVSGGPVTITVNVADGTSVTSETFAVTIEPVNDAPTISAVADITVPQGTPVGPVTFTVNDIDATGSLVVTATSSDEKIVANGNIVLSGTGSDRTLSLTPQPDASGTVTIGLIVSDGDLSTETELNVTFTPGNQSPVISSISNFDIEEDTPSNPIDFTIDDPNLPTDVLTVTAVSRDQSLIRDEDIVISGTGSDRTIEVTPVPNASGGPVTIEVSVSDGMAVTSTTFDVGIVPVNDSPTILPIQDQATVENTPTNPIELVLSDTDDNADSLTVTAQSSDTGVLRDRDIVISGTGANRTVTLTPRNNRAGEVTVTLSVSDGNSTTEQSFILTVAPVNDAPVISSVNTVTIDEDTASDIIDVDVRDADSPNGRLVLTATSSDQSLISDGGITISGGGGTRRLVIRPQENAFGTATITLSVTDGDLVTTTTFDVVVNPVNDSPEFAPGTDHSLVVSDTTGITVSAPGLLAGVTDAEDDPITVRIVDPPDNGTLIVDAGGAFTYQADSGFFGQDTFSFLVTDGQDESDVSQFVLQVPIVVPKPTGGTTGSDESTVSSGDGSPDSLATTEEDRQNDTGDLSDVLVPQMDPTALQTDNGPDEDDDRVLIVPPEPAADDDSPAFTFPAPQISSNIEDAVFAQEIRIDTADSDRVSASALDLASGSAALGVDLASLGINRDAGAALLVRPSVQHFAELRATAEQIDTLNEDLASGGGIQRITADAVKVGSTGLVIGTVFATLRGGMLFLGLLSQLPVWTFFDPLMVMDGVNGGDEGDSLQDIVDKQTRQSEQNSSSNQSR